MARIARSTQHGQRHNIGAQILKTAAEVVVEAHTTIYILVASTSTSMEVEEEVEIYVHRLSSLLAINIFVFN